MNQNVSEPTSDEVYRRQLEQSIFVLLQQYNNESRTEEKTELRAKIEKLQQEMAKNLVVQNEISMTRLSHLEEIFKHYCTHIFRVGKHMTFDRLQYEKVHIAMDRFFKFLSDFKLTTAAIDGKEKEVVSKNKIITVFKKVSSTSKDLNFQEFMQCLERLGIIYNDQKYQYKEKVKQEEQRRRRIKESNERKALKKANLKKQENIQNSENQQSPREEGKQEDVKQEEAQEQNENDDMVKDMMANGSKLDHPADEVDKLLMEKQQQLEKSIEKHQEKPVEERKTQENEKLTIKFTNEQKIEMFYRMIGVDNANDFRNKLSELNLPLFKPAPQKKQENTTQSETKPSQEDEEAIRLQKIKQKINQKKALVKNQTQSPKLGPPADETNIKKAQQERRIKKQRQRQRLEKAKKLKQDQSTKKAEQQNQVERKKQENKIYKEKGLAVYKQNNVTFDGIQKLNFQQLNLKQFHPHNLYHLEPEDEQFMGDLRFDQKNLQKYRAMNRVREKKDQKSVRSSVQRSIADISTVSQQKQKKVEAVVENAKRRVNEVQLSERTKEKQIESMTRKLSEAKTPRKLKA